MSSTKIFKRPARPGRSVPSAHQSVIMGNPLLPAKPSASPCKHPLKRYALSPRIRAEGSEPYWYRCPDLEMALERATRETREWVEEEQRLGGLISVAPRRVLPDQEGGRICLLDLVSAYAQLPLDGAGGPGRLEER